MCVKILDMTTAAAPDGHATDATIRATVRALCSGKGWTVAQLGARIGIPTSSMYYKLNRGGGDVHIHVHGSYVGSKDQLARTVVDALNDAQNRGLRLNLRAS